MYDDLVGALASVRAESLHVYSAIVLPNWGTELHGFGFTLHAYMMQLLALVDLASQYAGLPGNQTARMTRFLEDYIGAGPEAARVAVKVWRHLLMHTGRPREVRQRGGGTYYWLLHWGEHLPQDQHFTFTESGSIRILNLGMFYLLADLIRGCERLVAELRSNPPMEARAAMVFQRRRAEVV